MNTKAFIASTLLTALFASQSAIAGQDSDQGVFSTNTAVSQSETTNKVRFDAPSFNNAETVLSGRK